MAERFLMRSMRPQMFKSRDMMLSDNENLSIGLDISDRELRLVQFAADKSSPSISAIGNIGIAEGAITGGVVQNEEMVARQLKKLLAESARGSAAGIKVVACLPETKTYIKSVDTEKIHNESGGIVENEIKKHVPVQIKNLYYDWQITDQRRTRSEILFGAAPRTIVDQYIKILKSADLTVMGLEIEATAICRSLLAEENPSYKGSFDSNYCIVDIGATRSSLIIYSKNTVLLSVSLPISGRSVTETIANTLEISSDEAEKAKIVCGLDKSRAKGIICDILSDSVKGLIHRLNQALELYSENHGRRGPINKIILCGGGANINNLDGIIAKNTSLPVEYGDPFRNINASAEIESRLVKSHKISTSLFPGKDAGAKQKSVDQNEKMSYTTAVGLALRPIYIN